MSNNKIILNGCLDQFKTNNELTTNDSKTFELFSLTEITKSFDLTFEDIDNSIVDGGNDGGIDSIIVLADDIYQETVEDLEDIAFSHKTGLTIIISQCKKENSFKESAIDKLITTLPELFNLEKSEDALLVRFNSDIVEKGLLARDAWKKCSISGGKLKVIFKYCCNAESIEVNGAYESKIEQLKELANNLFIGAETDYVNYSCQELLKLYQTHRNQRLSLTFKESPLSTNYADFGIGYVGTVNLSDYKLFLTDEDGTIRDDLFESNIRHFQGMVDVNKKIKKTIINPDQKDFWWLNNGITIIANNPTQVGKTLSIDNVQIVNGLQTSYSIYNNHKGDTDDIRSVLVKVIINEDKETIDHIIASTNSQNPVSAALLRATDDVQRDIELFFLNLGYFYDRRKNYYKNQGKAANRIFSIQTAAQSIESIIYGNPHTARSKPTSLIKDDSTYDRIFDSSKSFNSYLNCCLILKKTNEFWGNLTDTALKTIIANFKLHLSRIATSFILGKSSYTIDELETTDLKTYDEELFGQTVMLLIDAINAYQETNQGANLINMAKARGLTNGITAKLSHKFQ
ncbi:MAG: AIPR family protein [Deltaproteobacteria bacterium]|nr:AIPR family protein [Deltaproteobacteria bacterium]